MEHGRWTKRALDWKPFIRLMHKKHMGNRETHWNVKMKESKSRDSNQARSLRNGFNLGFKGSIAWIMFIRLTRHISREIAVFRSQPPALGNI